MAPSVQLAILNLKNVCRLCSSKQDLVSIFDKKFNFTLPMQDIVFCVTTVQVLEEDVISQKICSKCVANTIKSFQFRDECIKNDKTLREKYKNILENDSPKKSITDHVKEEKQENNIVLKDSNTPSSLSNKQGNNEILQTFSKPTNSELPPKLLKPPVVTPHNIHRSVKNLFKVYPKLKVPSVILNVNIAPEAKIELNAVENYFKIRDKYISKRHRNIAVKSTSAPVKISQTFKHQKSSSQIKSKKDVESVGKQSSEFHLRKSNIETGVKRFRNIAVKSTSAPVQITSKNKNQDAHRILRYPHDSQSSNEYVSRYSLSSTSAEETVSSRSRKIPRSK